MSPVDQAPYLPLIRASAVPSAPLGSQHAISTRVPCAFLHSFVERGEDAYSGEKRGTEIAKAGPDT